MELFKLFLPPSSFRRPRYAYAYAFLLRPSKGIRTVRAEMRHSASERHSDYNLPLPLLFSSSFLAFVNLLVCLLLRHSWNFLRNKPRQPSAPKPKLVVGMSGVLFACEGFSGGDGDRSTWQAHHSLHLLRHSLRKEESARHEALS